MSNKEKEKNKITEAIGVARLKITGLLQSRHPSARKEIESLQSSIDQWKKELNNLTENPNAESHVKVKKNL